MLLTSNGRGGVEKIQHMNHSYIVLKHVHHVTCGGGTAGGAIMALRLSC